MLDTPEALLEAIRLGEDNRLELKAAVFAGSKVKGPRRDEVADEIGAIANGSGGVLVFGVDDETRAVRGIPEDRLDLLEGFVREICQDALKPAFYPRIFRLTLPDAAGVPRAVLRVDVPRSLFVHRSPGGYFLRVGSSKREMAPDHLARLFQQRSQSRLIRFDEAPVPGTAEADLDPALLERFRGESARDEPGVLARKLAMVRDEGGIGRLTVAGVLLGTRAPQTWMPHAFVQAVAYRGTEIVGREGYQLDARDLTGPLDEQVVETCRFVARNMRVEASKSMGRVDVPQFDLTAVFEAVVNAVAHRDYSMQGSKIRLRQFDDRLELYSPGALPNTMDLGTLPLRQATRNEAVTSLLAKCPVPIDLPGLKTTRATLMDRRGEGVPLIMRRTEELAGKAPEYRAPDGAELVLVIPAASARGRDR